MKKKLIISMVGIYLVGFVCSYTYFSTMEEIRKINIELYDDYSTPAFKTVIDEIFN